MSRYATDTKLYVGDLGKNACKQELEDAFSYYGPLRNVWVARNPPGFAFVEFEDPRDAEDAVRGLDGRTVCGRRARVEMSNGKGGGGRFRGPMSRSRGRPFHPDDRCYECGDRGHYARDCSRRKGSRRRSRSRSSRDRSRSRSKDRRSRSRSGSHRSRSRSRSRSRRDRSKSSGSKDGGGVGGNDNSGHRSRSNSRRDNDKKSSRSRSKSRSRSRSRSYRTENGETTPKN